MPVLGREVEEFVVPRVGFEVVGMEPHRRYLRLRQRLATLPVRRFRIMDHPVEEHGVAVVLDGGEVGVGIAERLDVVSERLIVDPRGALSATGQILVWVAGSTAKD
jgi:non-ribosomal peptide synthetase component F